MAEHRERAWCESGRAMDAPTQQRERGAPRFVRPERAALDLLEAATARADSAARAESHRAALGALEGVVTLLFAGFALYEEPAIDKAW